MKLKFAWLGLFILTARFAAAQNAPTSRNPKLPDFVAKSAHWVDVDGNGRLDLFMAGAINSNPNKTLLLQNMHSGFVEVDAGLPYLKQVTFDWADFDGDGDPDLLLAGFQKSLPEVNLWRNEGNFKFERVEMDLPQLSNAWMKWIDLDLDGDPDLLMGGHVPGGKNEVHVFENVGGKLNPRMQSSLETKPMLFVEVAQGMLKGDKLPSLVLMGNDGDVPSIYLWKQPKNWKFELQNIQFPNVHTGSISFVDLNGDGKVELSINGNHVENFGGYWLQKGKSFAAEPIEEIIPAIEGPVVWADFNQDGRMDFVCAGEKKGEGYFELFLAKENGQFEAQNANTEFKSLELPLLRVADWDGDGHPDVLLSGLINERYSALLLRWDPKAGRLVP